MTTDPLRPSSLWQVLRLVPKVGQAEDEVERQRLEDREDHETVSKSWSPSSKETEREKDSHNGYGLGEDDVPCEQGSTLSAGAGHAWEEIDVLYRPPPLGLSEVTVPAGVRWYWNERVARYVTSRNGVGEDWRRQVRRALQNLPGWFARLGFEAPTSASAITRRMIEVLRDTPLLAPCTRQNWTSKLRGFLGSEGCPLSTEGDLWHFGAPVPRKRPYLDIGKAKVVLDSAQGRERLVVVLGLFNGLRACEMSRLRVRDLELGEQPPTMWVLGKGTRGGKPRRIPVNPMAYGEIAEFVRGKRPEDPVYPGPYGAIDKDWRRVQRRAGFVPVGTHALRRSFGRISHDAGTPTAEIQAVYGHAAESTTSSYIGIEEQRMARGMAQMAAFFQEAR